MRSTSPSRPVDACDDQPPEGGKVLAALRDVGTGLVSSLLFGILTFYFNKWRKLASSPGGVESYQPTEVQRSGTSIATVSQTKDELLERRRDVDRVAFWALLLLSGTVLIPFLLGGGILAIVDSAGPGSSSFITDRMRSEADYGYVQYWLGFSVLAVIEILVLLVRPWRGRAFGVGLGIALAIFLIVFGIPASRGVRIF
jgi:ABC-type bacteriocin/lantibiotic exporter with double-glycine peptidase domain